jgi:dephospho-CoA kinase
VLLPDGEAYVPVVAEFGRQIVDDDGRIDRKKLAALVFDNSARLKTLTGFVHPAVFRLEQKLVDKFAALDPLGICVIEAAILIEANRTDFFDKIILTVCDPEIQIARAMRRDNATREQVAARVSNQMPEEEKREHADFIVDTSGTKQQTAVQVFAIQSQLLLLARGGQEN